jgi:hypothetical protein
MAERSSLKKWWFGGAPGVMGWGRKTDRSMRNGKERDEKGASEGDV